jgi:hypothetical protein
VEQPNERREEELEPREARTFWRGVAETFAIVAAFVGLGLAAGSLAAGAPGADRPRGSNGVLPYTSAAMAGEGTPRVWLIDGFNALHVAVLRGRERSVWWSRAARERLLARVRGFEDRAAEVWVVFDGPHPLPEEAPGSGPRVVFARSADEWLLRRAGEAGAGAAVVTADRRLAARARARGARVVSPGDFLSRCAEAAGPSGEKQAPRS